MTSWSPADGAQAWNLLLAHGADLVVADVEMPRMDGLRLCAAIRQSQRFRDVPVVLVTGLEASPATISAGTSKLRPRSSTRRFSS
jgi:two-component system chemotaxis sensor kinase CheA